MSNVDTDADREHLLDSVRSAMQEHGGSAAAAPTQDEGAEQLGAEIAQQMDVRDRAVEQDRQPRDGKGRFARADAQENPEQRPNIPPDRGFPESDVVSASGGPPSSWSTEARNEWNKLSPALQQAVLKRESEVDRGFSDYRAKFAQHAELESALSPYKDRLAQSGRTPAQAVAHLFQVNESLERDPVNTSAHLLANMPLTREQCAAIGSICFQRAGIDPSQGGMSEQQVEARFHQLVDKYSEEQERITQQRIREAIAADRAERARMGRKLAASSASMAGAPYGVSSAPPPRKPNGTGLFSDIAEDVRSAMAQHG
jgi:hypothetical protein